MTDDGQREAAVARAADMADMADSSHTADVADVARMADSSETADMADMADSFDRTVDDVFRWVCRLVAGDIDVAEAVLIDAFVDVRADERDRPPAGQTERHAKGPALDPIVEDRLLATAYRFSYAAFAQNPDAVRDRALVELIVVRARNTADAAAILSLDPDSLTERLAAAERSVVGHAGFTRDEVDRHLRSFEHWLDPETRVSIRTSVANRSRPDVRSGNSSSSARAMPGRATTTTTTTTTPITTLGRTALTATTMTTATMPRRSGRRSHSSTLRIGLAVVAVVAVIATAGAALVASSDGRSNGEDGESPFANAPVTTLGPSTDRPDAFTAVTSAVTSAVSGSVVSGSLASPDTTVASGTDTGSGYIGPELTLGPGYVLARLPDGYQPSGVSEGGWAELTAIEPRGWFDLWATPGSSRMDGRWVAISKSTCSGGQGDQLLESTSQRLLVNDEFATIRTDPDGLLTITIVSSDLQSSTIALVGFGFTPVEIQAVAEAVVLDDSARCAPDDGIVETIEYAIEPDQLYPELHLLRSTPSGYGTPFDGFDETPTRVAYYHAADPQRLDSLLWVTARPQSTARDILLPYLTSPSPDPAASADRREPVLVNGHSVVVSAEIRSGNEGSPDEVYHSIEWTESRTTITLSGPLPLEQLLDFVADVREASPEEWLQQATPPAIEESFELPPTTTTDPSQRPTFFNVGSSTTASGTTWQLLLSATPDRMRLVAPGGGGSAAEENLVIDPAHAVREYNSAVSTVLTIVLRDAPDGSAVRVTVGSTVLAAVPLVAVEDSDVSGAIVAFGDLPPYTVELLDPTGAVVRPLTT